MPLLTPHVPSGLIDIMKDLAKEVLREKPENIYEFAVVHFEKLIKQRDGSLDKGYEQFVTYEKLFDGQQKFAVPANSGYICQKPVKIQPIPQPKKSKSDIMASFQAMESIDEEDVFTENIYADEKYEKAIYVIQRYYRRYQARKKNPSSTTLSAFTAAIIIQRTMRRLFMNKIKLKTEKDASVGKQRDGVIHDDMDNVSEAASYTSSSTIQMLADGQEGRENRLLEREEVLDGGAEDYSSMEFKEQTIVAELNEPQNTKEAKKEEEKKESFVEETETDRKSINDENGDSEPNHQDQAPKNHLKKQQDDTSTAHIGNLSTVKIDRNVNQNSPNTNTIAIKNSNSSNPTNIKYINNVEAVGNIPLNSPQSFGSTPETLPATSPQSINQKFAVFLQDNKGTKDNASFIQGDGRIRKFDPDTREPFKMSDIFYQDNDDPDFSDSLNESTMEKDSLDNEEIDVDSLESNEIVSHSSGIVKREIKQDDGSLYDDSDCVGTEEDMDTQKYIEIERVPTYLYGIHPTRTTVVEKKQKIKNSKDLISEMGNRSPDEKSEEESLDSKESTSGESSATQIENESELSKMKEKVFAPASDFENTAHVERAAQIKTHKNKEKDSLEYEQSFKYDGNDNEPKTFVSKSGQEIQSSKTGQKQKNVVSDEFSSNSSNTPTEKYNESIALEEKEQLNLFPGSDANNQEKLNRLLNQLNLTGTAAILPDTINSSIYDKELPKEKVEKTFEELCAERSSLQERTNERESTQVSHELNSKKIQKNSKTEEEASHSAKVFESSSKLASDEASREMQDSVVKPDLVKVIGEPFISSTKSTLEEEKNNEHQPKTSRPKSSFEEDPSLFDKTVALTDLSKGTFSKIEENKFSHSAKPGAADGLAENKEAIKETMIPEAKSGLEVGSTATKPENITAEDEKKLSSNASIEENKITFERQLNNRTKVNEEEKKEEKIMDASSNDEDPSGSSATHINTTAQDHNNNFNMERIDFGIEDQSLHQDRESRHLDEKNLNLMFIENEKIEAAKLNSDLKKRLQAQKRKSDSNNAPNLKDISESIPQIIIENIKKVSSAIVSTLEHHEAKTDKTVESKDLQALKSDNANIDLLENSPSVSISAKSALLNEVEKQSSLSELQQKTEERTSKKIDEIEKQLSTLQTLSPETKEDQPSSTVKIEEQTFLKTEKPLSSLKTLSPKIKEDQLSSSIIIKIEEQTFQKNQKSTNIEEKEDNSSTDLEKRLQNLKESSESLPQVVIENIKELTSAIAPKLEYHKEKTDKSLESKDVQALKSDNAKINLSENLASVSTSAKSSSLDKVESSLSELEEKTEERLSKKIDEIEKQLSPLKTSLPKNKEDQSSLTVKNEEQTFVKTEQQLSPLKTLSPKIKEDLTTIIKIEEQTFLPKSQKLSDIEDKEDNSLIAKASSSIETDDTEKHVPNMKTLTSKNDTDEHDPSLKIQEQSLHKDRELPKHLDEKEMILMFIKNEKVEESKLNSDLEKRRQTQKRKSDSEVQILKDSCDSLPQVITESIKARTSAIVPKLEKTNETLESKDLQISRSDNANTNLPRKVDSSSVLPSVKSALLDIVEKQSTLLELQEKTEGQTSKKIDEIEKQSSLLQTPSPKTKEDQSFSTVKIELQKFLEIEKRLAPFKSFSPKTKIDLSSTSRVENEDQMFISENQESTDIKDKGRIHEKEENSSTAEASSPIEMDDIKKHVPNLKTMRSKNDTDDHKPILKNLKSSTATQIEEESSRIVNKIEEQYSKLETTTSTTIKKIKEQISTSLNEIDEQLSPSMMPRHNAMDDIKDKDSANIDHLKDQSTSLKASKEDPKDKFEEQASTADTEEQVLALKKIDEIEKQLSPLNPLSSKTKQDQSPSTIKIELQKFLEIEKRLAPFKTFSPKKKEDPSSTSRVEIKDQTFLSENQKLTDIKDKGIIHETEENSSTSEPSSSIKMDNMKEHVPNLKTFSSKTDTDELDSTLKTLKSSTEEKSSRVVKKIEEQYSKLETSTSTTINKIKEQISTSLKEIDEQLSPSVILKVNAVDIIKDKDSAKIDHLKYQSTPLKASKEDPKDKFEEQASTADAEEQVLALKISNSNTKPKTEEKSSSTLKTTELTRTHQTNDQSSIKDSGEQFSKLDTPTSNTIKQIKEQKLSTSMDNIEDKESAFTHHIENQSNSKDQFKEHASTAIQETEEQASTLKKSNLNVKNEIKEILSSSLKISELTTINETKELSNLITKVEEKSSSSGSHEPTDIKEQSAALMIPKSVTIVEPKEQLSTITENIMEQPSSLISGEPVLIDIEDTKKQLSPSRIPRSLTNLPLKTFTHKMEDQPSVFKSPTPSNQLHESSLDDNIKDIVPRHELKVSEGEKEPKIITDASIAKHDTELKGEKDMTDRASATKDNKETLSQEDLSDSNDAKTKLGFVEVNKYGKPNDESEKADHQAESSCSKNFKLKSGTITKTVETDGKLGQAININQKEHKVDSEHVFSSNKNELGKKDSKSSEEELSFEKNKSTGQYSLNTLDTQKDSPRDVKATDNENSVCSKDNVKRKQRLEPDSKTELESRPSTITKRDESNFQSSADYSSTNKDLDFFEDTIKYLRNATENISKLDGIFEADNMKSSKDTILQNKAALLIQSVFRGYSARKFFKTWKAETTNIKQFQRRKRSLVEMEPQNAIDLDKAATKIQSAFRGHQIRKTNKENTSKNVEKTSSKTNDTLKPIYKNRSFEDHLEKPNIPVAVIHPTQNLTSPGKDLRSKKISNSGKASEKPGPSSSFKKESPKIEPSRKKNGKPLETSGKTNKSKDQDSPEGQPKTNHKKNKILNSEEPRKLKTKAPSTASILERSNLIKTKRDQFKKNGKSMSVNGNIKKDTPFDLEIIKKELLNEKKVKTLPKTNEKGKTAKNLEKQSKMSKGLQQSAATSKNIAHSDKMEKSKTFLKENPDTAKSLSDENGSKIIEKIEIIETSTRSQNKTEKLLTEEKSEFRPAKEESIENVKEKEEGKSLPDENASKVLKKVEVFEDSTEKEVKNGKLERKDAPEQGLSIEARSTEIKENIITTKTPSDGNILKKLEKIETSEDSTGRQVKAENLITKETSKLGAVKKESFENMKDKEGSNSLPDENASKVLKKVEVFQDSTENHIKNGKLERKDAPKQGLLIEERSAEIKENIITTKTPSDGNILKKLEKIETSEDSTGRQVKAEHLITKETSELGVAKKESIENVKEKEESKSLPGENASKVLEKVEVLQDSTGNEVKKGKLETKDAPKEGLSIEEQSTEIKENIVTTKTPSDGNILKKLEKFETSENLKNLEKSKTSEDSTGRQVKAENLITKETSESGAAKKEGIGNVKEKEKDFITKSHPDETAPKMIKVEVLENSKGSQVKNGKLTKIDASEQGKPTEERITKVKENKAAMKSRPDEETEVFENCSDASELGQLIKGPITKVKENKVSIQTVSDKDSKMLEKVEVIKDLAESQMNKNLEKKDASEQEPSKEEQTSETKEYELITKTSSDESKPTLLENVEISTGSHAEYGIRETKNSSQSLSAKMQFIEKEKGKVDKGASKTLGKVESSTVSTGFPTKNRNLETEDASEVEPIKKEFIKKVQEKENDFITKPLSYEQGSAMLEKTEIIEGSAESQVKDGNLNTAKISQLLPTKDGKIKKVNEKEDVFDKEKGIEEQSATTIQKTFRGYNTRKHLKANNDVAERKIHSSDFENDIKKCHDVHEKHSQFDEVNQKGHSKKEQTEALEKLKTDGQNLKNEQSAIKIQKTFRGYKARKNLKNNPLTHKKVDETHATNNVNNVHEKDIKKCLKNAKTIEAIPQSRDEKEVNLQGRLTKEDREKVETQSSDLFENLKREVENFKKSSHEKCATTIQKNYRGYRTRKQLKANNIVKSMNEEKQKALESKKLLEEKPDETLKSNENEKFQKSATKIQKTFRGYKTRKLLKSNKDNRYIKNAAKKHVEKGSAEQIFNLVKAAMIIQKNYRGYKTRKTLDKRLKKVCHERKPEETEHKAVYDSFDVEAYQNTALENAAKVIQKTFRGYKTRKDLKTKKMFSELENNKKVLSEEQLTAVGKDENNHSSKTITLLSNDTTDQNSSDEIDTISQSLVSLSLQENRDLEKSDKKTASAGAVLENAASTIQKAFRKFHSRKINNLSGSPIKSYSDGNKRENTPKEVLENSDESSIFIGPDTSFDLSDVDSVETTKSEKISKQNSSPASTPLSYEGIIKETDRENETDSPTFSGITEKDSQISGKKRTLQEPTAPPLEEIHSTEEMPSTEEIHSAKEMHFTEESIATDQKPQWYVGDELIIPSDATKSPFIPSPISSSTKFDELSSVDALRENLNLNRQLTPSTGSAVVSTSSLLLTNDNDKIHDKNDVMYLNKHSAIVSAIEEDNSNLEKEAANFIKDDKLKKSKDSKDDDASKWIDTDKNDTTTEHISVPIGLGDFNDEGEDAFLEISTDLCQNCADGIHATETHAKGVIEKNLNNDFTFDDQQNAVQSLDKHFDEIKEFVLLDEKNTFSTEPIAAKVDLKETTAMPSSEPLKTEPELDININKDHSSISSIQSVEGKSDSSAITVKILGEDHKKTQNDETSQNLKISTEYPSITLIPPSSEDDISERESVKTEETENVEDKKARSVSSVEQNKEEVNIQDEKTEDIDLDKVNKPESGTVPDEHKIITSQNEDIQFDEAIKENKHDGNQLISSKDLNEKKENVHKDKKNSDTNAAETSSTIQKLEQISEDTPHANIVKLNISSDFASSHEVIKESPKKDEIPNSEKCEEVVNEKAIQDILPNSNEEAISQQKRSVTSNEGGLKTTEDGVLVPTKIGSEEIQKTPENIIQKVLEEKDDKKEHDQENVIPKQLEEKDDKMEASQENEVKKYLEKETGAGDEQTNQSVLSFEAKMEDEKVIRKGTEENQLSIDGARVSSNSLNKNVAKVQELDEKIPFDSQVDDEITQLDKKISTVSKDTNEEHMNRKEDASSADSKVQEKLEKLIEDNQEPIKRSGNSIESKDLPTENASQEVVEDPCIKKIIPPNPILVSSDQDESELESTTTKAESTTTSPGYDDASENDTQDLLHSKPDTLEAMTNKLRETEAMVERMRQRRASEHRISIESTDQPLVFEDPVCEPIKSMQKLQKSSSTEAEDELVLQKLQQSDTTRESSAQSEVIFGDTTSQVTESDDTLNENSHMKAIASNRGPFKPPSHLYKSVTIDDTIKYIDPEKSTEESIGSFSMDDAMSEDVRKKMMAYSVSEADSDYYESAEQPSRPHDDFNISTALDDFPSTDTDTTIVSAATKIQAGARGFLTRRRIRRASMGTKASVCEEMKNSFGNDAIGESLDELEDKELTKGTTKVQFNRQTGVNSLPSTFGQTINSTKPDRDHEKCLVSTVTISKDYINDSAELEDDSTQMPVNLEATLARRLTLQRGDAMRNDSTPEEENGNGKQVDLAKDNLPTISSVLVHEKTILESTTTTTSTTTKTRTETRNYTDAATATKKEKIKWFAMRQNSMPVQIESEVFRVLPKHMRKRIKSADAEKIKRIRLPRD